MKTPIIGITANLLPADPQNATRNVLSDAYVQAVLRAGGVPVIIPPAVGGDGLQALLSHLDGVLLSGGSDLDPARFNGIPHPRVYGIDPLRDEQEIWLVQQAAQSGKPFLGICRGIQSINVALGGTLYTDIADQLPGALRHDWYNDPKFARDYLAHTVTLQPDSRLAKLLGSTTVQVNSLHHQAILAPAASLRPVACSPDGLVEAVELPGHPFGIGVQWHPECLPDMPEQQAIFRAFIQAAIS